MTSGMAQISAVTGGPQAIARMLDQALTVSAWSKSPPGRQHGCILAVDGRYVVATGYNGPPRDEGVCGCEGKPKSYCDANCKAVHAEVNAICNAAYVGARTDRCVAYVTKKPCDACRGALINSGVRAILWLTSIEPGKEVDFEWEIITPEAPPHRRLPRP